MPRACGPLPPTIGKLRNVHYFDVHSNTFQGSIPSEIDGLHSVEYLYLDHNQLTAQVPLRPLPTCQSSLPAPTA